MSVSLPGSALSNNPEIPNIPHKLWPTGSSFLTPLGAHRVHVSSHHSQTDNRLQARYRLLRFKKSSYNVQPSSSTFTHAPMMVSNYLQATFNVNANFLQASNKIPSSSLQEVIKNKFKQSSKILFQHLCQLTEHQDMVEPKYFETSFTHSSSKESKLNQTWTGLGPGLGPGPGPVFDIVRQN